MYLLTWNADGTHGRDLVLAGDAASIWHAWYSLRQDGARVSGLRVTDTKGKEVPSVDLMRYGARFQTKG